jgi:hypothetical protein
MNTQVLAIGSLTIQIASGAQIELEGSTLTFEDATSEARLWGLLSPGRLVPVRFESATIADPDGRAVTGPTLGVVALTLDDTAGQVFAIQFPTAEEAARVRTQILVAGALAGALALSVGAGNVTPPPSGSVQGAVRASSPASPAGVPAPDRPGGK